MRIKNKKIRKLRAYRDKLLMKITNLEGTVRQYVEIMHWVRKSLQQEDVLRAYALASDPEAGMDETRQVPIQIREAMEAHELVKELTLVYRFLVVERKFTEDMHRAAEQRDYLRVAAICADHELEAIAHEKMLHHWSKDHGFRKSLIKESQDEDVI